VKRVLAGLVLLALSGAAVYGYTVNERERGYRRLLAEGDAALAQENTAGAVEAFSGAITLKPESMLGYLKRGQAYRRRGEIASAIRDLRRASEIDPTATRPLEELGDVFLADTPRRYTSAADRYEAYVRLDNHAPRVLYKLAYARYNDGRTADAIAALRASLALDASSAEAHYLLGLCERDARHPDLARQSLERAIALQPALLAARAELAGLDAAAGAGDARLEQLQALAALDPRPAREIALGIAYAAAGQTDRAVITLGHVAERHPDQPAAYVALGRVWLDVAQSRRDRVALNKALEALEASAVQAGTSEALTLLGRARLLSGDAAAAERTLQDATRREPIDPLAFSSLADAAEQQGHYRLARAALLDYAALTGEPAEGRARAARALRLGALSLRLDDYARAAAFFLAAADDLPGDAAPLARAADAQLRAGDRDAARGTAARALEKDPRHALAIAVLRRAR
jgi:tetratricopeptide (TPR) repeat protein